MKALLVIVLSLATSVSYAAQSKNSGSKRAQIKVASPHGQSARASNNFFNVRVEPHWLLLGELALDFQIRLGRHFSIGPTLGYMNGSKGVYSAGHVSELLFSDDKTSRIKYGIRGTFTFSDINTSSAYLSAFANRADNTVTYEGSAGFLSSTSVDGEGKFSENLGGLTAGYQWKWSLISLNVGGGVGFYDTPENLEIKHDDGSVSNREIDHGSSGFILDAGVGINF